MKSNYKRSIGLNRKLSRIEEKLDIILSDLTRINVRLLAIEQNQKGIIMDETINRLHESAKRMKEMAEMENMNLKRQFGI